MRTNISDYSKWVTGDGRVLHIVDMTDNHLKNCIDMLGDQDRDIDALTYIDRLKYISAMHVELKRRLI